MNINFGDLAQYAIVAAAVSAGVQLLKNYYLTSPGKTRAMVILASLIFGTAFYFIKDTAIWVPFVAILGIANTLYLYLIKPFET